MTPDSLHDLFTAAAGVAGALIGLLFVAISIEHERLTARDADQVHRIRASAALTSFTNALTVSLFALIPGQKLGVAALVVGVLGLAFVVASLLSLRHGLAQRRLLELGFLGGLGVTFALQVFVATRLLSHPDQAGLASDVADLVIVCFLIGIYRSWELIGGPDIGLSREVRALVRDHREDPPAAARAPRRSPDDTDART